MEVNFFKKNINFLIILYKKSKLMKIFRNFKKFNPLSAPPENPPCPSPPAPRGPSLGGEIFPRGRRLC
jgi:hypothetical protein